ncbi:unnamed protein product [Gongylonema pulchrum]|uniref:Innexin n=1 Tax=Gongylonema pulchrum TaxID=637853 RepID=A0A183D6D3_9BILA|nr:unnamed protein product [Gongylonema pulchrum]
MLHKCEGITTAFSKTLSLSKNLIAEGGMFQHVVWWILLAAVFGENFKCYWEGKFYDDREEFVSSFKSIFG